MRELESDSLHWIEMLILLQKRNLWRYWISWWESLCAHFWGSFITISTLTRMDFPRFSILPVENVHGKHFLCKLLLFAFGSFATSRYCVLKENLHKFWSWPNFVYFWDIHLLSLLRMKKKVDTLCKNISFDPALYVHQSKYDIIFCKLFCSTIEFAKFIWKASSKLKTGDHVDIYRGCLWANLLHQLCFHFTYRCE